MTVSLKRGMIALMGSGELTATMVEVHKEILGRYENPKAVFLDTPAGFQLNVGHLSQRAVEYFRSSIGYPMKVASFKSRDIGELEAEQAFSSLREADYILVGPGSPTYAVLQWRGSSVPEILLRRLESGACLVAASAAALTTGRLTLPVYEIYKVGEELHWTEGLDILGHFGFNLIIIPHWNNTEGGTHDTRFCFMGEDRFRSLEALLPDDVAVLGLDEHTACLIDLDRDEFSVRGTGTVTLRYSGAERVFQRGDHLPLHILRVREVTGTSYPTAKGVGTVGVVVASEKDFWDGIHALEQAFHEGLETDARDAANAILAMDSAIWKAQHDGDHPDAISPARELLRELVILLGTRLAASASMCRDCLSPLVDELLSLRASFRERSLWAEADALRDCLKRARIEVDDTPEGSRWRMGEGR